jgi:hypothetical protein
MVFIQINDFNFINTSIIDSIVSISQFNSDVILTLDNNDKLRLNRCSIKTVREAIDSHLAKKSSIKFKKCENDSCNIYTPYDDELCFIHAKANTTTESNPKGQLITNVFSELAEFPWKNDTNADSWENIRQNNIPYTRLPSDSSDTTDSDSTDTDDSVDDEQYSLVENYINDLLDSIVDDYTEEEYHKKKFD